jgi:hypothetical protein
VTFDPDDVDDMVEKVGTLMNPEVHAAKRENVARARDRYCWEVEEVKLKAAYDSLVRGHPAR